MVQRAVSPPGSATQIRRRSDGTKRPVAARVTRRAARTWCHIKQREFYLHARTEGLTGTTNRNPGFERDTRESGRAEHRALMVPRQHVASALRAMWLQPTSGRAQNAWLVAAPSRRRQLRCFRNGRRAGVSWGCPSLPQVAEAQAVLQARVARGRGTGSAVDSAEADRCPAALAAAAARPKLGPLWQ